MSSKLRSRISIFVLLILLFTTVLPTQSFICYAEPQEENQEGATQQGATQQTSIDVNTQWPDYPAIYAEAGVLIEASSGTILYEKNCHNQMYPASITKIMTTLLALEYGNLNDVVTFSHYDVYSLEPGDAHVSMDEGELLSLNDCLYAIMLASANEVSNAVAEYVAKKQPAYTEKISQLQAAGESYDDSLVAINVFADMMNSRAAECGAKNTHFCNPNGLFNENHYTTCYDMAMITREAIKNDQFLKIESQTSYVLPATNLKTETQPIANRHKMLFPRNTVYYEGILGGKTGYVDQSGNTLVTFARRNGMTLISVVMKSNSENVYNDTKLLLDYGFNNFSLTNIAQNEDNFTPKSYSVLGKSSSIFSSSSPLITINPDDNVVLPNSVALEHCTSHLTFSDDNPDVFATLEYKFGDRTVGSTTLTVNQNETDSFNFGPALEEAKTEETPDNDYITINIWVVLGVIVIIIVLLLVLYYLKATRISRQRRRRRRNIRKNRQGSAVRQSGWSTRSRSGWSTRSRRRRNVRGQRGGNRFR